VRVDNNPVQTPEDVVYHWERAARGLVTFHCRRTETHRLELGCLALQTLGIAFTTSKTLSPAPIVATTGMPTHAQLRELQQQGWPQPGDLLLAVNGQPVATAESAAHALSRVAGPDGVCTLSVRRGWPLPLEGEAGSDCCCFSTLTRIPRPRIRGTSAGTDSVRLADMAPPLLTTSTAREVEVEG